MPFFSNAGLVAAFLRGSFAPAAPEARDAILAGRRDPIVHTEMELQGQVEVFRSPQPLMRWF